MITRGFESSHGLGGINPRISVTVQATVFIAMFAVVGILSFGAATQNFFAGDLYVTRSFQSQPYPFWSWLMETTSLIGSAPTLLALAAAVGTWFHFKGQTPECLLVVAGVLSTAPGFVLKLIVGRERPSDELVVVWRDLNTLSFPSGHAFTSIIAFGLLCYLAPMLTSNRQMVLALRGGSVAMIALIGMSRVYLGVHWASDVVGGFIFGGLTLGVLIAAHSWWSRRGGAAAK